MTDGGRLVTRSELAAMLGVTHETIRRWEAAGRLTPVSTSRPRRYRLSEVEAAGLEPRRQRASRPWHMWVADLLVYYRDHGHILPPTGSGLSQWMSNARRAYREGRMSAEEVAALERVPGWSWNPPTGRAALRAREGATPVLGECAMPGCRAAVVAGGLCLVHYSQQRPTYGAPDGYGRYGMLDRDDEGRLLCHECGRWWQQLATHVRGAHGVTAAEYRKAHGLSTRTRLVGTVVQGKLSARWDAPDRERRLERLAEVRDIGRARSLNTREGHWRPERVAKRMAVAAARRVDLTAAQVEELGDVTDIAGWAARARRLMERDGVSAAAIGRAVGLTSPTVLQRLRRYPG